MQTVVFYSYKGGVGRTLLVANTAHFLAMSGHRVVALDLDLEAPGLHHKLCTQNFLTKARDGKIKGAVDLMTAILNGERLSIRDVTVDVAVPSNSSGSLTLIPAGSAPSLAYWKMLEGLNHSLRSNRRDGGLLGVALEAQARIANELNPEFLLIDARTGITELGGLATSVLADRVVILTTMTPECVEGTRVVADALRTLVRPESKQPVRLDFLITRVPPGSIESDEVRTLARELGEPVMILPHDPAIATQERLLSDPNGPGHGSPLLLATLAWITSTFRPDAPPH